MTLTDEERRAIQRTAIDQAKADLIEGRIRRVETEEFHDEISAIVKSVEAANRARKVA